jgi:hypothetical protein
MSEKKMKLMSARNFENDVQQKMEELHLSPSDAVWTNVEGVIRKDKRRRRIIFLFSTVMVLGLAGWLVSNHFSASSTLSINNNHSTADSKSRPDNSEPSSSANPAVEDASIANQGTSPTLKNTVKSSTTDNLPSDHQNSLTGVSGKLPVENKIISEPIDKTNVDHFSKQTLKLAKSTSEIKPKKIKEQGQDQLIISGTNSFANKSDLGKNISKDKSQKITTSQRSVTESIVDGAEQSWSDEEVKSAYPMMMAIENEKTTTGNIGLPDLAQSTLNQYTVSKKEIERKKAIVKSAWHFGINASVGLSKLVQGGIINAFEKSLVADAASINTSVGLPGPVNLQSRAPLLTPAAVNTGPAFTIGGFAERRILKKVNLSAGLNYTQFSTKSKIGYRVDSTLFVNNSATVGTYNRFYQNTPSQNYESKYHFIELPVNLQFRLTKQNKIPVYLNGGLSLGYLFKTNALQYDGSYGLYYSENSLFRKWQLGLSTGLSVRLFSSSKHPLELGPQLRFNPSNNFSSSKASSEHLFSAGLQLKWYLK